jgi:hypothetical protein
LNESKSKEASSVNGSLTNVESFIEDKQQLKNSGPIISPL